MTGIISMYQRGSQQQSPENRVHQRDSKLMHLCTTPNTKTLVHGSQPQDDTRTREGRVHEDRESCQSLLDLGATILLSARLWLLNKYLVVQRLLLSPMTLRDVFLSPYSPIPAFLRQQDDHLGWNTPSEWPRPGLLSTAEGIHLCSYFQGL